MRLPPASRMRPARDRARLAVMAGMIALASLVAPPAPALAQGIAFPNAAPPRTGQGDGQMVLQADTITYDNDRQVVVAEGGVQIAYNGNTIQAERVTYNRQTRRLTAEGNVRIVDTQGQIYHANSIDLSDDFRDGFVRTLRLERPQDRTRFSADSAERRPDDVTVFNRGTYTACEPCRDDPERPPLWQVRAARIIHDQREQTIHYENAAVEFFGVPAAWLPYFWSPDGTVRRRSGFLFPHFISNNRVGSGLGVPYYFALSPFYDLLVTPVWMADQGLHLTADWRHALPNGWYRVRVSGIMQQNPETVGIGRPFPGDRSTWDPGAREWRGAIETWGQFQLSERWSVGWDLSLDSDQRYFRDYGFMNAGVTERISTLYLQGRGDRSFFDLRAYHIRTYSFGAPYNEQQAFMPWVAPVMDYQTAMADPWLGGELRANVNFTHIRRTDAMAYRFVDAANVTDRWLTPGFAGDYTRLSVDAQWRRTFTDAIGQRWTPFFRFRGDVYGVNPSDRAYNTVDLNGITAGAIGTGTAPDILPQLFRDDDRTGFRAMPTAGLEYRYPFIAVTESASHIIEPVAQVVVRPNETRIGRLPNEDAQSLVFDDTNLFAVSRFSGYDRIEGGSRVAAGIQYTLQTSTGFLASVLFGQSYQFSGLNSFAMGRNDLTGAGLDSGLETARSDYVARIHVQPFAWGDVTARFRFDERDFQMRRMEIAGQVTLGQVSLSGGYTFIAAQPNIGIVNDREEINLASTLRLTQNWSVFAGGRYSLQNTSNESGWVYNQIGLRYMDDCFTFSVDYTNIYPGFGDIEPQRRIMARITLRTLGDITVRTTLGNNTTN